MAKNKTTKPGPTKPAPGTKLAARAAESELREQYYRTVPLRDYNKLSGRQNTILYEFGARYNIPCDRPVVDLFAVIRGLHDLVAKNARAINSGDPDDQEVKAMRERVKLEKEQIELARQKDELIPRDAIRDAHSRIASRLKECGAKLQKQFGDDALELFNETLSGMSENIEAIVPEELSDEE